VLGTLSRDRERDDHRAAWRRAPVMLVTFESTPFDPAALDLAIAAAGDRSAALVAVNVIERPVGRGPHTDLGDPPAVVAEMRDALARATRAGLEVQWLRVCTTHVAEAVVDIAEARAPALVVIGADLERRSRLRLSRRRYRRALRALATRTDLLLWSPGAELPPALLPLADRSLLAAFGHGRHAWAYALPPLRFTRP
jgi:nucleotide-binding universal stress UspA family protein